METNETMEALRESIIHGLRMRGWSRIEAENEADERIELARQRKDKQVFRSPLDGT